jgi:hypothetical protein
MRRENVFTATLPARLPRGSSVDMMSEGTVSPAS